MNTQTAPYPDALAHLIDALAYKPGWTVTLADVDRGQDSEGLTLVVITSTSDSYQPLVRRRVAHYFPVPPAAYDARSWQRWLFDQLVLVELHEAMEFFTIDDVKPYAPSHGPGNDPYMVREVGTLDDQHTSAAGVISS